MTDNFPLCRQAGLQIHYGNMVEAAVLEQLLVSAPVVYGFERFTECGQHDTFSEGNPEHKTHSARLIMIEPLRKDSAESLLREWVSCASNGPVPHPDMHATISDLIERARKVLGE